MTRFENLAPLALLLGSLSLAACSAGGGESSGTTSSLFVQTCSLGCNNGLEAEEVTCDITVVALNEEFSILFSEAIAEESVTPQSFQIQEEGVGSVPDGVRSVDPNNPRRVIFRPAISFVGGTPSYALKPDTLYTITVPGEQDGGDRIRSVSGRLNRTRVSCTIRPTNQVIDPVPGPPTYEVLVDRVDPVDGLQPDVPADGQDEVDVETRIRMVFNDIMNPATLGSGTISGFIRISADEDGNEFTPGDQTEISGFFQPEIDLVNLRTVLTFIPAQRLPSVGALLTRKIVVFIPPSVQDLAGNSVEDAGNTIFSTQVIPATPVEFSEDFTTVNQLNQAASGAFWGDGIVWFIGTGGGDLFGHSGGTGRLGELVVGPGETVVISTDTQAFPLASQTSQVISNVPSSMYDPADPASWPVAIVTDGIFEFESLTVEPTGTLVFQGTQPARVFVRGDLVVNGTIDVSGASAPTHNSSDVYPSPGALGGPFGGRGGSGATRINNQAIPSLLDDTLVIPTALGDDSFPGNVDLGLAAMADRIDGQDGEGVGVTFNQTRGRGGMHWPDVLPTSNELEDSIIDNGSTIRFSVVDVGAAAEQCRVAQVAQPGSGGAYASSGGQGLASVTPIEFANHVSGGMTIFPPAPNAPDPTDSGDATGFLGGPGDASRTLYVRSFGVPEVSALGPFGALRGGSGGGGAGAHLFFTPNNGCGASLNNAFISGGVARMNRWYDHSGASGGGGGGALQLCAGRRLAINFLIDASGGDGGSSIFPEATFLDTDCVFNSDEALCGDFASPGGGGSGGAILLQGREISFSPSGQVLDVRGGTGGRGVGFGVSTMEPIVMTGSQGGDGGHGLVRIEDRPLDPADAVDIDTALDAILPPIDMSADPAEIVSLFAYGNRRVRPESFSGSVSCWLEPPSGTFLLNFLEDDALSNAPEDQGWNLTVLFDDDNNGATAPVPFPYRGVVSGQPTGAMSFEEVLGNMLNQDMPDGVGSVVAVRFQGARSVMALTDACNVDLDSAEIVPQSLTPWVQHPSELNQFSPRPNIVRVAFFFDIEMFVTSPGLENRIQGFTDLRISAVAD